MAANYGNLKQAAVIAKTKRSGAPEGKYKAKLVSIQFGETRDGKERVEVEWVILDGMPSAGEASAFCGKKINMNINMEGKGELIGREQLGELLGNLCEEVDIDLEQYSTRAALVTLFLQLAQHTFIRWLNRKMNKTQTYMNHYLVKEPVGFVSTLNSKPVVDEEAPPPPPPSVPAAATGEFYWAVRDGKSVKVEAAELVAGEQVREVGDPAAPWFTWEDTAEDETGAETGEEVADEEVPPPPPPAPTATGKKGLFRGK